MFGIDDAIIAGVGGSMLSGFMNNSAASSRQSNAQDFSAQQFATRYQTTTADMKAAGLNPMLAYSQGGGSAPTSSAASSSGFPDMGESFNRSKTTSAQVELLQSQSEAAKAQAKASSAQAAKTESETPYVGPLAEADIGHKGATASAASASVGFINAQAGKIAEEVKNIPIEGRRLEAVISNLAQSNTLMQKQGLTEVQRASQLKNLAAKVLKENHLLNLDIEAADFSDNFGRRANEFREVIDVVKDLIPHRFIDRMLGGGKTVPRTTRSNSTTYDREGNISGGRSSTSTTE